MTLLTALSLESRHGSVGIAVRADRVQGRNNSGTIGFTDTRKVVKTALAFSFLRNLGNGSQETSLRNNSQYRIPCFSTLVGV